MSAWPVTCPAAAPRPAPRNFGKAFEHFILMELKAYQSYRNPELEIRFWRTSTGQEVDFILGDREVAVEIKGGTRVHEGDLTSLRALLHDQPVKKAIVVCRESLPRRLSSPALEIMPWERFLSALWGGELGV